MAQSGQRTDEGTPPPGAGEMAGPFLQFDLKEEIERLRRAEEAAAGQNARTLVKYDDFRIVLITLDTAARIPVHQTAGRISIHCVAGRLRIHAEGRSFDLASGGIIALDRAIPHEVEAVEQGALLLTIAWGEEALEAREALGGKA